MQNDNEKKKIKKPSGMRTNFAFQAAVLAGAGILSQGSWPWENTEMRDGYLNVLLSM